MKKLLPYILIFITLVGIFDILENAYAQSIYGKCKDFVGTVVQENVRQGECPENTTWEANTAGGSQSSASSQSTDPLKTYTFLAPLPCDKDKTPGCTDKGLSTFDATQKSNLGVYLNIMIKIFIGICAVLAVIMIVIGGLEYMTSELPGNKEDGRSRITNAIFGLVLAVGSYLLLNTINPDLLKTDLGSLENVEITLTLAELPDGSYSSTGGAGTGGRGGTCTVQTNPNNACSPTKLAGSCFGNRAEEASKICNLESNGGQTSVKSGSDLLNNGTGPSYSVGLWQINLTVHQVGGLNCPAAFSGPCGRGTATRDPKGPFVGGPKVGNCSQRVTNQTLYDQCVAAAQNPTNNTAVACKIYGSSGFKPWAYSAGKCSVRI